MPNHVVNVRTGKVHLATCGWANNIPPRAIFIFNEQPDAFLNDYRNACRRLEILFESEVGYALPFFPNPCNVCLAWSGRSRNLYDEIPTPAERNTIEKLVREFEQGTKTIEEALTPSTSHPRKNCIDCGVG